MQIYAVEEQPLPFLVMEFIPGETLQQRLDQMGPLDVADILRIGGQIAEGLAAAHATGLIHRDIKPGNVLLESGQSRVKITDFGLARAADDASLTQSGVLAGTPMYMAPEQAKGETLDHRADLFSLGSVLYVMATGRPPFRASTTFGVLKRVVEDTPRPIREVIPELPQWLADVIAKLHAKKPADRFQSAREVAAVLADYEAKIEQTPMPANSPLFPGEKVAAWKLGRWLGVAAAVVLLAALGMAWMKFAGVSHLWRAGEPSNEPAFIAKLDPPKNDDPPPAKVDPPKDMPLWTILKPIEMKSAGGATLTLQDDGSILVGGELPALDVYTLTCRDLPARIQALRLEVLPHESLPQNGPGRHVSGNFHLTTIKAQLELAREAGHATHL